jgi:hypothetical protein
LGNGSFPEWQSTARDSESALLPDFGDLLLSGMAIRNSLLLMNTASFAICSLFAHFSHS